MFSAKWTHALKRLLPSIRRIASVVALAERWLCGHHSAKAEHLSRGRLLCASSVSRQARAPRKFENPSDRDIYMGLSALRQVPRTGRHRRLQWEHGRNGCPREFVAWRKSKVEENQTKWPQRHRITTTRMTTDKRISLKSPAASAFKAIGDSRNNSACCHLLRRTLPSPLTPPAPGSA